MNNMWTKKEVLFTIPESTIAFGSANTPLPAISPVINIAADSTVRPFGFLSGCKLVSLLILTLLCLLLGEVCNYKYYKEKLNNLK